MSITTVRLAVGDQVAAAYRNPVSPDFELTVDLGDGAFEAVALKTIDSHIQQGSVNTVHADDSIQWVVFNRDEELELTLEYTSPAADEEDLNDAIEMARHLDELRMAAALTPEDLVGVDKTEGQEATDEQ